ncbi:MAG: hypothetical protein AB7L91_14870 [Dehalococcoidia bacterium]
MEAHSFAETWAKTRDEVAGIRSGRLLAALRESAPEMVSGVCDRFNAEAELFAEAVAGLPRGMNDADFTIFQLKGPELAAIQQSAEVAKSLAKIVKVYDRVVGLVPGWGAQNGTESKAARIGEFADRGELNDCVEIMQVYSTRGWDLPQALRPLNPFIAPIMVGARLRLVSPLEAEQHLASLPAPALQAAP